jgi:hypothetical protein
MPAWAGAVATGIISNPSAKPPAAIIILIIRYSP